MSIKQIIIVRRDLEMRKGKLASQVAHASMAFLHRSINPDIIGWRRTDPANPIALFPIGLTYEQQSWLQGNFAKVVLWVAGEAEFHAVVKAAQDAGLVAHPIQDDGRTDFHGVKTWTTAGIGPDTSERLDPITGHLRLVG